MNSKEFVNMMDLYQALGMKDVSTKRQEKNGTKIIRLPIKKYGSFIEVGSFQSGYVRRMNGCYTPYQLNKCENYDHFYPEYTWERGTQFKTGKYNKHVCRRRLLIDNEYDRINYLITYCLKNYYINQANEVENGNFVPKWKHEYEMKNKGNKLCDEKHDLQCENNRLHNIYLKQTTEIQELQKRFEETAMELDELTVSVNGNRYKVI